MGHEPSPKGLGEFRLYVWLDGNLGVLCGLLNELGATPISLTSQNSADIFSEKKKTKIVLT